MISRFDREAPFLKSRFEVLDHISHPSRYRKTGDIMLETMVVSAKNRTQDTTYPTKRANSMKNLEEKAWGYGFLPITATAQRTYQEIKASSEQPETLYLCPKDV